MKTFVQVFVFGSSGNETAGSYDNAVLNFLRDHYTVFSQWMYQFPFPPAMCSNFSTSLPTLIFQLFLLLLLLLVTILVDIKTFHRGS